jgi:hypothetical protein
VVPTFTEAGRQNADSIVLHIPRREDSHTGTVSLRDSGELV